LCFLHWLFFFSSRRRHTRFSRDWSSDVCSSDLVLGSVQGNLGTGSLELLLPLFRIVDRQRRDQILGCRLDQLLSLDQIQRRHQRSEEHTSELQSRENLVCRLLLEKKNKL